MRATKDTAEKALNVWLASFRPDTASNYRCVITTFLCAYDGFDTENIEPYLATLKSYGYKQSSHSILTRFARFIDQPVFTAEPAEEPAQTELAVKTEQQPAAQPLPDNVKAELDRRAQLTREFLEIGARFRNLPPEAVRKAVDTLRNAEEAAQENFKRSPIIDWTAGDWQTASNNAAELFAELQADRAVIKAFDMLLQIVEVGE